MIISQKTGWTLALLIVVLLSVSACSLTSSGNVKRQSPAPDFKLMSPSGGIIQLSGYQGKIVLLNFWATWCPPCREEIPDLIELYQQYHDQGFEIIGIALDNPKAVESFSEEFQIPYPLAISNNKVLSDYGSVAVPMSFLVDTYGIIVNIYYGPLSKDLLEKELQPLLGEE